MPDNSVNALNDLLLNISEELSLCDEDKMSRAVENGTSVEQAFKKLLISKKILIIIDQFHRSFIAGSNHPLDTIHNLIRDISHRHRVKSRILILTNKLIDEAESWVGDYNCNIKTVDCLNVQEAENLLEIILTEKNRSQEVPLEHRHDIVNFLGCNQRAIEVFVASLRKDSWQDLIGINPERWETKERKISEKFLYQLEENLLEQILSYLSPEIVDFLQRISVYRKKVQRKALEILITDKKKRKKLFVDYRNELIDRFILEKQGRQKSWFTLHPIAKEIALKRLRENNQEFKHVHYIASEYYTRHFKSEHFSQEKPSTRGGKFVEARYHLVQAGQDSDLKSIAYNFEKYLLNEIRTRQKIPYLKSELDEIIIICLALRESLYSQEVEYYLAKLLKARGKPEDLKKALFHTRQATEYTVSYNYWIFRIDLELQINGIAEAIKVAKNSLDNVAVDRYCSQLYLYYADLLVSINESDEAIILLEAGIDRIPPKKGLSSLYNKCAELLAKQNKLSNAVELLNQGIKAVPEKPRILLYRDCGKLLAQDDKLLEAIELVKLGIEDVLSVQFPTILYELCGELLIKSGSVELAIELFRDSIKQIPVDWDSIGLYKRWSEVLARSGEVEEAIKFLQEGIYIIPAQRAPVSLYQRCAEFLAQSEQKEAAIKLLQQGIHKIPPDKSHSVLYKRQAEYLAQLGDLDPALNILNKGIEKIKNSHGRVDLYLCGSRLLLDKGKTVAAIKFLKQGIKHIPPDKGLRVLYESCANLLAQSNQIEDAIELLQQGIQRIPKNPSLYVAYGNLLAQDNRIDEAIEILEKGIDNIPKNSILYMAYGNLLTQDNRIDNAIKLFQEGINNIPPEKNVGQVYIAYGILLVKINRIKDAIAILRDGISKIPFNQYKRYRLVENAMLYCLVNKDSLLLEEITAGTNRNSLEPGMMALGKVFIAQLKGEWQQAAEIAHQKTQKFSSLLLLAQAAFSWLCVGNIDAASEVLQSLPREKFTKGYPLTWLKAFIAVKKGDTQSAAESLIDYLGRPLQEDETISQNFLLYLWDTSVDFSEGINIAFNFPTLPPSLTGLEVSITRQQNDIRVLPDILDQENLSKMDIPGQKVSEIKLLGKQEESIILSSIDYQENKTENITLNTMPKVFISYNHNDQDIANLIKKQLEAEQIDVTIDSESLLGGQDIKEFIVDAIKNTDVTLSLVSKNSLMSAWVAMESIKTISVAEFEQSKKFIPCLVKDSISSRTFTDDVLDIVENEIEEINNLIKKRAEKNRNTRDLQNELTRFKDLEFNIDEIVRRIKESSYIDLRGNKLNENFPKLLKSILN